MLRLALYMTSIQLISIAYSVPIIFVSSPSISSMVIQTTFSPDLVKLTRRPSVADDMLGLNSIFDAISDDEVSARSPTVPTPPFPEDDNPAHLVVSCIDSC